MDEVSRRERERQSLQRRMLQRLANMSVEHRQRAFLRVFGALTEATQKSKLSKDPETRAKASRRRDALKGFLGEIWEALSDAERQEVGRISQILAGNNPDKSDDPQGRRQSS